MSIQTELKFCFVGGRRRVRALQKPRVPRGIVQQLQEQQGPHMPHVYVALRLRTILPEIVVVWWWWWWWWWWVWVCVCVCVVLFVISFTAPAPRTNGLPPLNPAES